MKSTMATYTLPEIPLIMLIVNRYDILRRCCGGH
jgi:hypothetical protein